jgi:4-hydroxy-2-oxoheptanedioate aldolase
MKSNQVRAKLKNGEPVVGTWLVLPDPFAARLMADVGFDWLTVELEHTPTSFETAALSFLSINAAGCVPLARVPWNTGENIKRVLDTGAWGVVVPMVNSRAEAEAVVAGARYQPLGKRSIGGQLHTCTFATSGSDYYAKANDEIIVVVMAEHVDAIERIDEIASVPGIDVIFIGPNDLLNSMGKPPAFHSDDPQFTGSVKRVLEAAKKNGVAAGIHVVDPAQAQQRIAEGFQFIAIGSEAGMMLSRASDIAKTFNLKSCKSAVKY